MARNDGGVGSARLPLDQMTRDELRSWVRHARAALQQKMQREQAYLRLSRSGSLCFLGGNGCMQQMLYSLEQFLDLEWLVENGNAFLTEELLLLADRVHPRGAE